MALSKFLACTFSAAVVVAAAACADGTGTPFTPTLPSTTSTAANADGTTLKVSAPTPQEPSADAQVPNLRPTLTIGNPEGTYSEFPLSYTFELYEGDTLLRQTNSVTVSAQSTSWEVPTSILDYQRSYRWRARAYTEGLEGPWSDFMSFRTGPKPAGNVSPGPVPCAGSSGPEIIACVAAAYPEKLVKTNEGDFSDERRAANMAFIRDRVIETGRCLGMDLARNFKRGTPVISHDFIVLRRPGHRTAGVDIARGYDNNRERLQLGWQVWGPPSYGHPFYAPYPGPIDCSAVN